MIFRDKNGILEFHPLKVRISEMKSGMKSMIFKKSTSAHVSRINWAETLHQLAFGGEKNTEIAFFDCPFSWSWQTFVKIRIKVVHKAWSRAEALLLVPQSKLGHDTMQYMAISLVRGGKFQLFHATPCTRSDPMDLFNLIIIYREGLQKNYWLECTPCKKKLF